MFLITFAGGDTVDENEKKVDEGVKRKIVRVENTSREDLSEIAGLRANS